MNRAERRAALAGGLVDPLGAVSQLQRRAWPSLEEAERRAKARHRLTTIAENGTTEEIEAVADFGESLFGRRPDRDAG